MKTTNTALYLYTELLINLQSKSLGEAGICTQQAATQLDELVLYTAKIDDTGWLIELSNSVAAKTLLTAWAELTVDLASYDYGIKVYSKRNSIALRVSLTGSI